MPIDILMPQLSPTMTEGRLARWLKKEGDAIKAGQVIAEVETDKATMEVEASDDGIIHKIVGEVGTDLPVGTPIAVLRGAKEEVAADYVPKGKGQSPEVKAPSVAEVAPIVATKTAEGSDLMTSTSSRVKASPLARRLASQQGIRLESLQGSGPHGRIVAKDIQNSSLNIPTYQHTNIRRSDSVARLSPMRKAIAKRLTESKQTVPHFYLKMTADVSRLMAMREELNADLEARKVKLSVNDFIIKASALALRDYPAANASWQGDSIVQYGNVDISVAVAIEGGLITPIVQNADQKTLPALSTEMKKLAADAKAGALKPHQYEGGSFSISNLGMYGIDEFAAIVNPPQAAILAVGKASAEGKLVLTLSIDHRVIDGALGAEVLGAVRGYLERPTKLIVDSW